MEPGRTVTIIWDVLEGVIVRVEVGRGAVPVAVKEGVIWVGVSLANMAVSVGVEVLVGLLMTGVLLGSIVGVGRAASVSCDKTAAVA